MSTLIVDNTSESSVSINTFPQSQEHLILPQQQHQKVSVKNYDIVFWSFIAGAITGGIEALFTYPIEYVKTHLQLQQISNSFSSSVPRVYNGMWDCVKSTVEQHNLIGLYRGFLPVLLGSIPKQASRWTAYEWATEKTKIFISRHDNDIDFSFDTCIRISNNNHNIANKNTIYSDKHKEITLSLPILSACGFFAGCVETVCAVAPAESIKTRLIHDSKQFSSRYKSLGTFHAVQLMLQESGFRRTFYSGVGATMLKQGLNQSLRFPAQKLCMDVLCSDSFFFNNSNNKEQQKQKRRKHPLWNGIAGFFAGVFSVIVTQPVDVVKTQLQCGAASFEMQKEIETTRRIIIREGMEMRKCIKGEINFGREMNKAKMPHISYMKCIRLIYHRRGIAGLYSGILARSVHVGMHVGLTFTVFPIVRKAVMGRGDSH